MKDKKKYLLIGHFDENIGDGQVVRSNMIKNQLKQNLKAKKLKIINFKKWKRRPISFIIMLLFSILTSNKIITICSTNGLIKLSRILTKFKKKYIYHIVIGGSLPFYLENNTKLVNRLKKYNGLFVQTQQIKSKMEDLGLNNVYILSNFKTVCEINLENYIKLDPSVSRIKFCTFSRITKSKGITDAINAVDLYNKEYNEEIILDIYGNVEDSYKEEFEELLKTPNVNYKGLVHYNSTPKVLKDYYALLFPTYFEGEGFAGTILDALYAGIPVIASDWNFNTEIIKDMENGLIVNINDPLEIKEAIRTLVERPNLRNEMGMNNLIKSKKYHPENVLKEFYDVLFNEKS